MREKKLQLIVTFHTTAEAMLMEKICKENNIKGRLIPVPREISAGCGMSWKAPLSEKEKIENLINTKQIENEELVELMFF